MSRDYKTRKASNSTKEGGGSAFFGGFVGYALGLVSAIGIWLYINYAPSPFLPNEKVASSSEKVEKAEPKPAPEQSKTPAKTAPEESIVAIEEKPRFDFYKILPGIEEPEIDPAYKRMEEKPVQPPAPTKIPEVNPKPVEIVKPPVVAAQPSVSPADTKPQLAAIHPRTPSAQPPTETLQPMVTPQTKNTKSAEKFFLQAGSFRSRDDAENMKARLALLGAIASIQPIDLAEKGTWYRVRVGPLGNRADVDEISATLRENGIAAQFIKAN